MEHHPGPLRERYVQHNRENMRVINRNSDESSENEGTNREDNKKKGSKKEKLNLK